MINKFFFSAAFIVIVLILFSFQEQNDENIDMITGRYILRYNALKKSIVELQEKIKSTEINKTTIPIIRNEYFKVRKAYKSWEYLGEFIDPGFVKDYINGAPLQKLEPNSFGANIIEPRGLQAIDELVFSNELASSKALVIKALSDMSQALTEHNLVKIYGRDVFIASRQALVRIYTLGVTGFDTPGSLNGLSDSKNVLSSMYEDLSLYINQVKDKTLADSTTHLFQNSLIYLDKNKNFNKFDRLQFLIKYINPLYKNLYEIHVALNFEMPNEISNRPDPINYKATNLFDIDFLKANYYTRVPDVFNNKNTIDLGRTLFFDPIISHNNQRSCASCHNAEKGFTDQLPTSKAYGEHGFLKRNSPSLINSVYSEKYFYDMRARSFEDQTEHVITSSDEFNTSFSEILTKINSSKQYQSLFKETFKYQDTNINLKYIQFALSAYVSSLQGLNSAFDKYVRGETPVISESVKKGYNLFMGKAACGTCHYAPIFNGTVPPYYKESESEVLGVPKDPYAKKLELDSDEGRGNSLLKERVPFYKHSFKTTTVRNVEFTFPYMHNGSYKTLEDVLDFYNNGGGKGLRMNVPSQTLGEDKLNLTKNEITDIIAFMKSLGDTSNLTRKPNSLPRFETDEKLNTRKIGGVY